jgi:hypothetical protein
VVLRSLTTTKAVAHELIPVAGGIGTGSRKLIGWGWDASGPPSSLRRDLGERNSR